MGGGTIMQQWGIGVSIFPPVCTGTQNPQNYFSNTYVLPSVNRTAGPTIPAFGVNGIKTYSLFTDLRSLFTLSDGESESKTYL